MAKVNRWGPPSHPRGLDLELVEVSVSTTINANHAEAVIQSTGGSGITITLPKNLPAGFVCMVEQSGAGQVTFSAASGASLVNRQSHTKTAGQYALTTLYVRNNIDGISAVWLLAGDTTA